MTQKPINSGFFILGGSLILALGLFFMGFFMFKSNNNQSSPYGMANSITVNGEGKTMVKPDMLIINLSISELADTTEKAQTQSNEKISKVRDLFSKLNIADNNFKTTSVNTSPEYDRNDSNGRKLLGYRSRHSMSITITGEKFEERGGELISEISKIGGITIDGTYFDLKDKNTALAGARDIALQDARAKAEQLAKASGSRLGKVITITDNTYYNMPGPIYYAKAGSVGDIAMDSTENNQSLSPGETEISVNVNVVYKIK